MQDNAADPTPNKNMDSCASQYRKLHTITQYSDDKTYIQISSCM